MFSTCVIPEKARLSFTVTPMDGHKKHIHGHTGKHHSSLWAWRKQLKVIVVVFCVIASGWFDPRNSFSSLKFQMMNKVFLSTLWCNLWVRAWQEAFSWNGMWTWSDIFNAPVTLWGMTLCLPLVTNVTQPLGHTQSLGLPSLLSPYFIWMETETSRPSLKHNPSLGKTWESMELIREEEEIYWIVYFCAVR